jgi:hypothetical protein
LAYWLLVAAAVANLGRLDVNYCQMAHEMKPEIGSDQGEDTQGEHNA